MERLQEILGALADENRASLTDEQIADLETEMLAIFDEIRAGESDDYERNDVETLTSIVDGVETLRTEAHERLEAAEKVERTVDELAERLHVEDESDDEVETADEDDSDSESDDDSGESDDDSGESDAETTDAPPLTSVEDETETPTVETDDDTASEDETSDERVPVAAAARRTSPGDVGRRRPARTRPRPAATPALSLVDPTTGASMEGGLDRLAEIMANRHNAVAGGAVRSAYTERVALGRIDVRDQYPTDRQLPDEASQATVERLITEAIGDPTDPARWTDETIIASGGFCAPTEVDYGIEQISQAMRPVRDGLPSFQAGRGGLRFPQPPTLASVDTDGSADAAITVHTNTADVAGTDKGVQVIDCASFDEVILQAIVRRLQFGNFGARAFPEQVTTWNELVLAAHARVAETELLDGILAASSDATTTAQLGATREIIRVVAQAAAAYRNRNRMAPDARLRWVAPAWIIDAMISDLAQGEQSDPAFLNQTRQNVQSYLSNLGVNVSFYVDSPTGLGQTFGAQGDAALVPFPDTVHSFLFHEGAFVFLDGGTLDLGIVRDSALNTTNDFQNFAETFENVAFRGIESVHLATPICVNGESQVAIDASTCVGS